MKVLFIGLGAIGQRHLRNIQTLFPDTQFIAYRTSNSDQVISQDLTISSSLGMTKKFSIQTYKSLDLAFQQKPFATIVANPSSLHLLPAIEALKNNSHVFIEKPLSSNLHSLEELLKLEMSAKNTLTTMVGFQLRFHPLIQKLKELLSNKAIGKVLSVRAEVCEYMPYFHEYEDYRSTYAAQKKLGGGVVLSQIHEIDLMIFLFGMPETILATGGQKSSLDIDVEDNVDILMTVKEIGIMLHMDFLQKVKKREGVIYGDDGRIEYNLNDQTISLIAEGDIQHFSWKNYERNEMFLSEIAEFFDRANSGLPSSLNCKEGSKSLLIATLIKQSIESKDLITVPLNI